MCGSESLPYSVVDELCGNEAIAAVHREAWALCSTLDRRTHARVAALESGIYMRSCLLRDADWAGMAHSIEVRAPLVDAALLKQVAALRASNGAVASKAALFAAPGTPIPAEIGSRAKTGFSTPVHEWQRPFGAGLVSSPKPAAGPPWARAGAVSVMKEFRGA